jgi:nitroreductase
MTAIEHMVLSAWELGYGTCWIGAFDQKEVKQILDVPEEMTVVSLLPIGVPDEKPGPKGRKPFEKIFFAEKYGKPLYI